MDNNPQPVVTNQPKKRRVLPWIVGSIAGLILGAVIGYFATSFIMTSKSSQEPATNNSQSAEPPASVLQPEDVTKKIKDTYGADYTLLNIDENNQPKEGEMSIRLEKGAPAYKAAGYDFYTTYDSGSTLYLMPHDVIDGDLPSAQSVAIRKKIVDIYTEFGLEKTTSHGKAEDSTLVNVYEGKGLICTIEDTDSGTSSNTASCGRLDAYPAAAALAKPFVDALPDDRKDTSLFLGTPAVTTSSVTGYQHASAGESSVEGVGGGIALFWKKDGGEWTFFTGTQNLLPCTSFNTVDLKNAFKGEACYDTAADTQSKVE